MKNIYIITVIFLMCFSKLFSVDYIIPEKLGINYEGKEFYLTAHPTFKTSEDKEDNVILYLSSRYKTKAYVKSIETDVNKTVDLPANTVVTVSIPMSKVAMYIKPKVTIPDNEQVWSNRALIVSADDPINCYVMIDGPDKTEGYMAIPKQSLGKAYTIASTANVNVGTGTDENTSFTSIVSAYDETKITITIGGNINNLTPKGLGINDQIKVTLKKGDIYLLPLVGTGSDLSGSTITSTKPISVISGNAWTHLPETNAKANYTIEQEIPIENAGTSYSVFSFGLDKHAVTAKIFNSIEETNNYFKNGQLESTMKNFGGKMPDAWNTLKFTSYSAANYTSDKPVNITLYETTDSKSAPFQMSLLSDNQFNKSYRFIRPVEGDKVMLSVVYKCPIGAYDPQGINISKLEGDKSTVKSLVEFEKVDDILVVTNKNSQDIRVRTILLPETGLFEINADYPIAAYLYGYKSQKAYGFPIGTYAHQLKYSLDSLAPIVETTPLDGKVIKGTMWDDDEMEYTQISGLSEPMLLSSYSSNVKFSTDDFSPGTMSHIKWNLEIIDLKKVANALVVFPDKAGNQYIYEYSYIPKDEQAPIYTAKINRFGDISVSVEDEPKNDALVSVGLKEIILESESENYSLNIDGFQEGMKQFNFSAKPQDVSKYGKAIFKINDKNDNSVSFTIEYKPDSKVPVCVWDKFDEFTIKGKISDMPDIDSIRVNLDTVYVSESDNVETIIDAYSEHPRDITFTLKQVDKSIAGSASLYARDLYGNDSTFTFNFEATSVFENDKNIFILPQPATEQISIQSNELILNICIYDKLGNIILVTNQNDNIDISYLAAGSYYCKISTSNKQIIKPFIKIK